ncbi:uncharacterized protein LOC114359983 [Ostrinia furnacalis]|uniref:uncharacterized protein LOC114359983 n=1 Tax=Ostrinia furnacalis TaxID=93504 RepID=UPI00103E9090|nr:uncharacterized protein LOC114359983 [Ostrinia furnacalis]
MCSVHFQAGCFQKKQQKMYLANYSIPTLAVHDVPVHCDKASSSETTEVLPMECDIQASNNLADTMTPRKLKLTVNLQRRTLIAENRKKKITALRSKTRRLVKKMQN